MSLAASPQDFAPPRLGADRGSRAAGLSASVLLHGALVVLLVLVLPLGTIGLHQGIVQVPVEVMVVQPKPAPPQTAKATDPAVQLPHEAAAEAAPDAGASPSPKPPAPDALELKLQALAQLRAPEAPVERPAALLPTNDSEGLGASIVKDIIRDQVERHWNLNLASLGSQELSVPIRVKITSAGKVLEAEIVENAASADPTYRDIAISARNAILSASPLALPAGKYQDVMNLVVYLNPRDTLR